MITKTLFLAGLMLVSALASKDEHTPIPAALLLQSNFDFSLTRKDFRVHYGGLGFESTDNVFIKIYRPNGEQAHSYELTEDEKKKSEAFHFALDETEAGKYEVEVCAGSVCSARAPSLTDFVTTKNTHKLSCEQTNSKGDPIEVTFIEPLGSEWAQTSDYDDFTTKINDAHGKGQYKTDLRKHKLTKNPSYKRDDKIFHAAIMHNLKNYEKFFQKGVNAYCGRKYMLSLHSHIVDTNTKKVLYRFKTVNHLSEQGKQMFILEDGGKILLESTQEGIDIPASGNYEVWVSLCVTDKDTVDSTYCANPITMPLSVE